MQAKYQRYNLIFKRPGMTSRGILTEKETYFLYIYEGEKKGIGECGIFRGLSYDDRPDYEKKLQWLCYHINNDYEELKQQLLSYPSIWFGYEQAMQNIKHRKHIYFPSNFTEKKDYITINGLIWMGDINFIKEQIEYKLEEKFKCIKLKIGVNWNEEKKILKELRKTFPRNQLNIRVDANGAFSPQKAKIVLEELALLDIHSIEQPIKAGNWDDMAALCANSPTPIALDEELIGTINFKKKQQLLETILPHYIILKPSLIGGFSGSNEWITLAEKKHIGWWITSALESNIGLNAIAQYTYTKKNPIPQGLGTGSLFTNNIPPNLRLEGDKLWFMS